MAANKPNDTTPPRRRDFWVLLGCLAVIMVALFHKSFLPEYVLHNNDTPFGYIKQAAYDLPGGISGTWCDLNWPGGSNFFMQPMPTTFFRWLFGDLIWAKFWTPLSQIILGLSAWLLFRRLKLAPAACVIGGLAAALHGDFFSNACWGQQSRPLALSAMLLALAALQDRRGVAAWLRVLLAGTSVGFGIMEGFDIAALFSIVVGVYALIQPWLEGKGTVAGKIASGVARAGLTAAFSAVVAAYMLSNLIGSNIKGVVGMGQDEQSKAERWAWATQWSLPKAETLTGLVPGLFGYRMDTPGGGQYWGTAGRDVEWDNWFASDRQGPKPRGFIRYGGAGAYSGPIIVLLALFAVFQAGRKNVSPFTIAERRTIWFWSGLWVICLLLAWGRFAPFYKFFYMLPYASTIRNPGKFFHICDWALLILCGYGVHALAKQYWSRPAGLFATGKNRWPALPAFDRKWVVASSLAVAASLLGWLIYGASKEALQRHLVEVQFDPDSAVIIAKYSLKQVGWFVLFLGLGVGTVAMTVTGRLSGQRAKFGAVLLGAILVADLARANLPWIVNWDWKQKYATNDVLDLFQKQPYEHRVAGLPAWFLDAFQFPPQITGTEQYFDQLYRVQWMQHEFQFYDIQSVDVVQMPRAPADYAAFESAIAVHSSETLPLLTRKWELTNTRYILAMAAFADFFNRQFDPGKQRFRIAEGFTVEPKPGILRPSKLEDLTAVLTSPTNGPYAIIEFTGALPRAKLYSNWQVSTNDDATLKQLADLSFDPAQTVLVADPIPASSGDLTNENPGTVEIVSYAPKRIELKANAAAPAVLLYNDRFTPEWQVTVDGKAEPMLRCNYIMRGVQLPPGEHQVTFQFRPDLRALKITSAGLGVSALAGLALFFLRKRNRGNPLSQ